MVISFTCCRSLASCQGVILLVDANQGVQAQTVANFYLAFGKDLVIVPVLNKIDLKNAQPDLVKEQLFNLFTIDPDDVLMVCRLLVACVTFWKNVIKIDTPLS